MAGNRDIKFGVSKTQSILVMPTDWVKTGEDALKFIFNQTLVTSTKYPQNGKWSKELIPGKVFEKRASYWDEPPTPVELTSFWVSGTHKCKVTLLPFNLTFSSQSLMGTTEWKFG